MGSHGESCSHGESYPHGISWGELSSQGELLSWGELPTWNLMGRDFSQGSLTICLVGGGTCQFCSPNYLNVSM